MIIIKKTQKGFKMTENEMEDRIDNWKEHRLKWVKTLPDNEKKSWIDFYTVYYNSEESLKDSIKTLKNNRKAMIPGNIYT